MNMKKLIGLALLGVVGSAAQATVWSFDCLMDGLQENPPNASPGTGFASGTVDDVSGAVSLSGTFSGLLASASAAHIHGLAGPGVNAGVLIPLSVTAATSGTVSGGGTLSAANVTGMLNGLTYVNIHTSVFPGGEIRGQIRIVPEPATFVALLGGAAAMLLRRRRTS